MAQIILNLEQSFTCNTVKPLKTMYFYLHRPKEGSSILGLEKRATEEGWGDKKQQKAGQLGLGKGQKKKGFVTGQVKWSRVKTSQGCSPFLTCIFIFQQSTHMCQFFSVHVDQAFAINLLSVTLSNMGSAPKIPRPIELHLYHLGILVSSITVYLYEFAV